MLGGGVNAEPGPGPGPRLAPGGREPIGGDRGSCWCCGYCLFNWGCDLVRPMDFDDVEAVAEEDAMDAGGDRRCCCCCRGECGPWYDEGGACGDRAD